MQELPVINRTQELYEAVSKITAKLANETTLHQLQAKVAEIGRMLGGWRKSVQ